jgi:hypothetical protein
MLLDYISLPVFLASFALGLLFVYVLGPEEKIIYVYPTPTNSKTTQFKDGNDECFQFKPIITKCPLNPLDIKSIPPQA